MTTRIFSKKTHLQVSASEAFDWHEREGAFERLLPPWEKIRIIHSSGSIHDGSRVELKCSLNPVFSFRWLLVHKDYLAGRRFCDQQISGPFSYYRHDHLFSPEERGSLLEDRIEYALPLPLISHNFAGLLIERRLERTFRYRHRISSQDLSFHATFRDKPKLNFLISGATGMIGSALCAFLSSAGHNVSRILRSASDARDRDIVIGTNAEIKIPKERNFDCVVNLAGAGIADRHWSKSRKKILLESRVNFTSNLVSALQRLDRPPALMISASGTGYYGDSSDNYPDERGGKGTGFLADLSEQWEKAAIRLSQSGSRIIFLRLGAVLSPGGGVLKKMLLPFSIGLGGKLGNGRQQFGWVCIDDVLRSVLFLCYQNEISGAVNVTAPSRCTNAEFTAALARVLMRPAFFGIPAAVLRAAFGELASELLLASSNANPVKLTESGFRFLYTDVDEALCAMLGKQ